MNYLVISNKLSLSSAFTFVFKEENWSVKVFVGGLVLLASVLIFPAPFLAWYQYALFKNILDGKRPLLPEWQFNKTNYFLGVKMIIIAIAYSFPSFVLGMFGGGVFRLLKTLYSLAMLGLLPFALGNFVSAGKLDSAFRFAEIWRKMINNLGILVIYAVGMFLSSLAGLTGLAGLVVAVIFTGFWSNLTQTYLMAKTYQTSK